jgi:hypothetical protein
MSPDSCLFTELKKQHSAAMAVITHVANWLYGSYLQAQAESRRDVVQTSNTDHL